MYSGLNGLLLRFPSDRYNITYTQGNDGDINNIISDCLSVFYVDDGQEGEMMEKWAIPLSKPKVHHSICQLLYYYYIHLFTKETHSDGDAGAASLGSVWGALICKLLCNYIFTLKTI